MTTTKFFSMNNTKAELLAEVKRLHNDILAEELQEPTGLQMIYSSQKTRYLAQKENPSCFAFYKAWEGGFYCFYCAQALHTWKNQK